MLFRSNSTNWGTKWDTENAYVEYIEDSDSMCVNFDTAWRPPDIWFTALAKKYPSLFIEMKYNEPDWGFCGIMTSEIGETSVVDNRARDPSTKYIDMMVNEFGYDRSDFGESEFEYEVRKINEHEIGRASCRERV